ncbi:MAG: hypothetical protein AABM29_02465 [Actinomycetota bacterium]
MRFPRSVALAVPLALAAISLLGCGGSDPEQNVESRPAPPASDFPSGKGLTLGEVLNQANAPSELVLSPSAPVFYTGENRFGFGVFERDKTQVPDAQIALYVAKAPEQKSQGGAGTGPTGKVGALDGPAYGPFPARIETLETEPAFGSQTTANDPDAGTAVYVTDIDFRSNGEWRIGALVKDGDQLTATLLPSVIVGQYTKIPQVGEKPPRIHTPTREDAAGDLSKITTRVPPDTQNEVDFYNVLGRKPVVLLFATPQFCESRTCGPVVDVAEQVKRDYGDKADFIHMEIYKDNDPAKGTNAQVRAFNLPSEPWLFVIDRNGVIRTDIGGAFSVQELENAVKAVTGQ